MGHRRLQIVAKRVPARQDWPPFNPGFEQAQRGRLSDLERADDSIAEARAPQRVGICGQQRADTAELGDQALGERFGVAAGKSEGEQIFDELLVEQRLGAALEQSLPQPRSMAARAAGILGYLGDAALHWRSYARPTELVSYTPQLACSWKRVGRSA